MAEKHRCKVARPPRKTWTMDPGRKLERQKEAAARRFLERMAKVRGSSDGAV